MKMSSKERKIVWTPPILKINKKLVRKGLTEPLLKWWQEVCQLIFNQTKQHSTNMLRTLIVPCCPNYGTYLNQGLNAIVAHVDLQLELKKVVYRASRDCLRQYHHYTLFFSVTDRLESPLFCLQLSRRSKGCLRDKIEYISKALARDLNPFLHDGLAFTFAKCYTPKLFGPFLKNDGFNGVSVFEVADKINSFTIHPVALFLRTQAKLTSLTLHLDIHTMPTLCKVLRKTSSLTNLCLSNSFIDDSHLKLLLEALCSHCSLHRLDLSNNRFTAASWPEFKKFLSHFESLHFLNLDGNAFPETGVGDQLLERSHYDRLRKNLRLRGRSLQIRCWSVIEQNKISFKRFLSPVLVQQIVSGYSSLE